MNKSYQFRKPIHYIQFYNWRHLSNSKLIVRQFSTSSRWLASYEKYVPTDKENFYHNFAFPFSATNKLINFNTFRMYKFYKAILYSPMNEQIYTRFFFYFYFIFFFYFMGDEKLKLFCGRIFVWKLQHSNSSDGEEDGLVYGVMSWWWCG